MFLTKNNDARRIVLLLLFCIGNCLLPETFAQPFYQSSQFNPNVPTAQASLLGILYNAQPYLIKNTPTTYHGNQDVYATAYLPFIETEYNAAKPLELFGSYYTTAIALCSQKDPAKGLYAPVHIAGAESKSDYVNSLASLVPYNPNLSNFKGPFNTLPLLNEKLPGFVNPVSSENGVTALKTIQEFTKFSHELLTDENGLGWDGFDKAGILPIECIIDPSIGISHYNILEKSIRILKFKYSNQASLNRSVIGHEITHGIVNHSPGFDHSLRSPGRQQMEEGFASVVGAAFSTWLSPEKFDNPHWNLNWEIAGVPPL